MDLENLLGEIDADGMNRHGIGSGWTLRGQHSTAGPLGAGAVHPINPIFEELGCEVIEARSGAEALSRLEERPDVTLMFTDCRMPDMSGPELAEEAARRWPHLRIVLVTGYHNLAVPGWPVVWKR